MTKTKFNVGDLVVIKSHPNPRKVNIYKNSFKRFEGKIAKITEAYDYDYYDVIDGALPEEPTYVTDILDTEVNPEGVIFTEDFFELIYTV